MSNPRQAAKTQEELYSIQIQQYFAMSGKLKTGIVADIKYEGLHKVIVDTLNNTKLNNKAKIDQVMELVAQVQTRYPKDAHFQTLIAYFMNPVHAIAHKIRSDLQKYREHLKTQIIKEADKVDEAGKKELVAEGVISYGARTGVAGDDSHQLVCVIGVTLNVQNFSDNFQKRYPQIIALLTKYESLIKILNCDISSGRGIDEFQQELAQQKPIIQKARKFFTWKSEGECVMKNVDRLVALWRESENRQAQNHRLVE